MASFVTNLTDTELDLKGATLVLPALSLGNVPQLALDLWINSRKPPRVALINSEHLTAACGYGFYVSLVCCVLLVSPHSLTHLSPVLP